MPVLGKQEDFQELNASLGYTVNSRPAIVQSL